MREKILLVVVVCLVALGTPLDARAPGDSPVVEMTTFSLSDLAATVRAAGLDAGAAKSLSAKLAAAEDAYRRGNTTASANLVRAFIFDIEAQSGKKIPAAIGAELISVATHITNAMENGISLGGAMVGPAGAILKITDPDSAAYGTELTIPPGALSTSVLISMSVPETRPEIDGFTFPGSGIHLEPSGLTFAVPVTLVLPYPDLDADGLVDGTGISANFLKVGAQDSAGYIAFLPNAVDAGARMQTTRIDHFSSYWNVVWRWPSPRTLTYKIDASVPEPSFQDAIRRAVAIWAAVWAQGGVTVLEVQPGQGADVQFTFVEPTAPFSVSGTQYVQDGLPGGGPVVVLIDNGTANAVMNIWFSASLPDGLAWTAQTGGSTATISLESAAVHALGHVTGLNDLTPGTSPRVMAPNADLMAPETCLLPADVDAFRTLYGVPLETALPACPDARVSLTPAAFDFGAMPLNTTGQKVFTVASTGTGTLIVSSASISGAAAFGIDTSMLPQLLRPGVTGTFVATFTPVAPGPQQATVTLVGNAVDSPTHLTLAGISGPVDPMITSFAPASGGPGQPVTIAGMNFGSTQASSTVTFRGVPAAVESWSDTSIVAIVPAGALTGKALVTVNGKASNWFAFTVSSPPLIVVLKPTAASVGQLVRISGDNFGQVQGSSTVTVNGAAASVFSWSSTAITLVVPEQATTGAVVVEVGGRQSNGVALTVLADGGPLTITAQVSPAPNAYGWNTTNVTVTFTCSDTEFTVVSCPSPTTIAKDGVGIVVVGQALDSGGHHASVTIALNVDRTAPLVNVSEPLNGAFSPSGTLTRTVRGSAMDLPSGIESANCNGTPATVIGQSFTCEVAVGDGSNAIQVEAIDRAGLITRRSVTLSVGGAMPAPLAIAITPQKMTMVGGDTRRLQVVNERGQPVVGGTWTISNSLVAEIVEDLDRINVRALGAGETTLTLTRDGLTAHATVSVFAAGTALPSGTKLWELPGTLAKRGEVLRPMWSPDAVEEQAALVYVDEGTEWLGSQLLRLFERPTQIRGTALDGRLLWEHSFTDTTIKHAAVDDHGGILLVLDNSFQSPTNPLPQRIRRLDGATGQVTWEFFAAYGPMSELAIAPDGKIYFVERPYYTETTDLVALDGRNGRPAGRWFLPNGHFRRYRNGEVEIDSDVSPEVTAPIVLDDGSVVVISHRKFSETYSPLTPENQPWSRNDIQLAEIPGGGSGLFLVLTDIVKDSDASQYNFLDLSKYRLLPDGQGGLLIAHKQFPMLRRVSPSPLFELTPEISPVPFGSTSETEWVVGEDAAYAQFHGYLSSRYYNRIVSFDPTTLTTLTQATLASNRLQPTHLRLRSALAGGGVFTTGPIEGYVVNASISGGTLPAGGNASQIAPGLWGGWSQGQSLQIGSTAAMAAAAWPQPRGNVQGANAGSRTYPTADAAAIAILRDSVPPSTLLGKEFGGSICRNALNRYRVSSPTVGEAGSVEPSKCMTSTVAVGEYHTHVGDFPMDGPSGGDSLRSYQLDLAGYIGVAADVTNRPINCAPQGNIWKIVMDTSVPYNTLNPAFLFYEVIACTPIR